MLALPLSHFAAVNDFKQCGPKYLQTRLHATTLRPLGRGIARATLRRGNIFWRRYRQDTSDEGKSLLLSNVQSCARYCHMNILHLWNQRYQRTLFRRNIIKRIRREYFDERLYHPCLTHAERRWFQKTVSKGGKIKLEEISRSDWCRGIAEDAIHWPLSILVVVPVILACKNVFFLLFFRWFMTPSLYRAVCRKRELQRYYEKSLAGQKQINYRLLACNQI